MNIWMALAIVPLFGACGGGTPQCVVGASAACTWAGGAAGGQTCQTDHSFAACVCGPVAGKDWKLAT